MLSNTHLMESELLSNIEGDVTTLKEKEEVITARPSTTEGSTTVTTRPTTAPEAVPTTTTSRPAPTGEQTVIRNPETIVNINTPPREIPVMIDPIVGIGAGSQPIIMGGGGGMAGNRSSAQEEEGGEPEKKGNGLVWLLITVAVVSGVWYGVKNWK